MSVSDGVQRKQRHRRVRYEYPLAYRKKVLDSLRTCSARQVSAQYQLPLSTLYRWRSDWDGSFAPTPESICTNTQAAVTAEPESMATRTGTRPADRGPAILERRSSGRIKDRLLRAHAKIERCYFENVDCVALAHICGMSKCHFVRSYTRMFSESPYQHLIRKRVTAAVTLLEVTLQPTPSIAAAVGFQSPSSLSRAIRNSANKGQSLAGGLRARVLALRDSKIFPLAEAR